MGAGRFAGLRRCAGKVGDECREISDERSGLEREQWIRVEEIWWYIRSSVEQEQWIGMERG